jgi:hypothetical protein
MCATTRLAGCFFFSRIKSKDHNKSFINGKFSPTPSPTWVASFKVLKMKSLNNSNLKLMAKFDKSIAPLLSLNIFIRGMKQREGAIWGQN